MSVGMGWLSRPGRVARRHDQATVARRTSGVAEPWLTARVSRPVDEYALAVWNVSGAGQRSVAAESSVSGSPIHDR